MKKLLLTTTILCIFASFLMAQEENQTTYGLKGGFNTSSWATTTGQTSGSVSGFALGGFINIPLSEHLSFQPEINYSGKGAADVAFFGDKFLFDYVEAPLLLQFTPVPALQLFAGPYAAFLVSASYSLNGTTTKLTGDGHFDYGYKAGARFNFGKIAGIGSLFIEGSYAKGLSDIELTTMFETTNQSIEFRGGITY